MAFNRMVKPQCVVQRAFQVMVTQGGPMKGLQVAGQQQIGIQQFSDASHELVQLLNDSSVVQFFCKYCVTVGTDDDWSALVNGLAYDVNAQTDA